MSSGASVSEKGMSPVRIRPGLNADLNSLDGLDGQPVFKLPFEGSPEDHKFCLGTSGWGLRFFGVLKVPVAYNHDTGAVIVQGRCYARVKAAATAYPGAYLAPEGGSTGHFYVSAAPTAFRLLTDLSGQTAATIYGPDNVTNVAVGPGVGVVPEIIITGPQNAIIWSAPALGTVAAVHAAVTDTGVEQTITTGFTAPAVPRNLSATSGGTAADIKAIQVTVSFPNIRGESVTEVLPVFTENSATTVVGSLACGGAPTSWTLPAHDGTGATTSLGTGAKLALPDAAAVRLAEACFLGGTLEGTLPTLNKDADEIEKNFVTLNSALNATQVALLLYER